MWTYCWTHGITKHSSRQCKRQSEGHQREATMSNRLGGNDHLPGPHSTPKNNYRQKRKDDADKTLANKKQK